MRPTRSSVTTGSAMADRPAVGLLDTCVVIDLGGIDPARLPVTPRISAVTLAELGLGLHTTSDPVEHAVRAERLQRVEAVFEPIPFSVEAARRFAHLAGLVVAAGRNPRPRRLDLMIAAVASIHELPLYTRSPKDFTGLDALLRIVEV